MRRTASLVAALALSAPGVALAQQQPAPYGQPGQAPAQPGQQPYGGMQAGGLTPPPPMQPGAIQAGPSGPATGTEQQLEDAKKEDSGRGLEIVAITAEGGFETLGLKTFNVNEQDFTAGFVDSTASGGVIGVGAAVRLVFLTLGARGRVGFFSGYQLFSLGGEVGAHIPLGNLEPHFDLGFGYVGLGSFKSEVTGAADAIQIRGFYGRVGGGLDYFLNPHFSLGGNVSWELLGLTRPGVGLDQIDKIKSSATTDVQKANADLLALDKTSYGSALAITAVAGLHF